MAVTRTVRYRGGAARAWMLVQMLEEEGVAVEWTPPQERRGAADIAQQIVVGMVATGAYEAVRAAVARFRARVPHAEVTVGGEEGEGG